MYKEDWECYYCEMLNNWSKDFCYWCKKPRKEESENQIPLYAPAPDGVGNYSGNYNYGKSYEMKRINPSGKGSDKYYWFICTPNFPSEQYKVEDPHCHARKNDWSGEARISLDPSTYEPTKLKVKIGKISGLDQTQIRNLVRDNKELIYQEWEEEWIR